MTRIAIAAALGASLLLGGCISLFPEPSPARVYALTSPPAATGGDVGLAVRVATVEAPRSLASTDIALVQPGGAMVYMAGAHWASPAPQLLHDLVVETIDAYQPGLAAVRPQDRVRGAYELLTEIREFEAEYRAGIAAAPTARVRLRARLVRVENRELVATRAFEAEAPASANRGEAIIAAMDAAAHQAVQALTGWAAAEIAADLPNRTAD